MDGNLDLKLAFRREIFENLGLKLAFRREFSCKSRIIFMIHGAPRANGDSSLVTRPFVFYTFFVEFYNFGSEKFYKKIVEFLRRAIFSTISVEIVEIL